MANPVASGLGERAKGRYVLGLGSNRVFEPAFSRRVASRVDDSPGGRDIETEVVDHDLFELFAHYSGMPRDEVLLSSANFAAFNQVHWRECSGVTWEERPLSQRLKLVSIYGDPTDKSPVKMIGGAEREIWRWDDYGYAITMLDGRITDVVSFRGFGPGTRVKY